MKPLSHQEFIKSLPSEKRQIYEWGYKALQEAAQVKASFNLIMKREEMHKNSGEPAPRCICNPNKVYKYIIGYVNKILVQAMVDADLGFSGLGLNMG
jgi:hypothetical protein